MTRAALEIQVLNELRHLPLEQAQEALDFVSFLRTRIQQRNQPQPRPIGLMQGKASCQLSEDFEISDEELLRS
ncbi:MAG: hypothetical protein ACTFAL_04475 [Candidatus Electronema sp. V4]|uniref:hypothetical protein n=1 Tax=Candidatus Electronema sp. V4 TaxID=3454756 RepID=UPI0040558041